MAHLRISVAGMMILLLGLGLVLASLRFPSDAAAAAVLLVTQAILAFAVLAVVYRAGKGRAFWLGFALTPRVEHLNDLTSCDSSTSTVTMLAGMSTGRGDEAMRPDQRVVTRLPLNELWDAHGVLQIERGRAVGREQVTDLLRSGRVRFVVANCGDPLNWIPPDDSYRFWQEEVKHHLVEPDVVERGLRLEDWPGEYCFVGTEWGEGARDSVVLLESHH